MSPRRAAIRSVASFLPSTRLTNDQLALEFGGDWTPQKILAKTGISVRHVCGPDECASDLGVQASQRLFSSSGLNSQDIDFLIFCTQSPDHFLPTTACLVHQQLGLRKDCGAIDINQGCSGYVYGLALAQSLVESGTAGNVLLITSETYSKFINRRDRSVRAIFGDAAAATHVAAVDSDRMLIGPFVFGTDGAGAQHLIVPAGGSRRPLSPDTKVEKEAEGGNWRSAQDLYMNGPEVFTFTLKVVPEMVSRLLGKAGLRLDQVDRFVFHQANKFMLDHLRDKIGIAEKRFSACLEQCGNTVSSTIPIALERDLSEKLVMPGNRVMLVGFGVGLSWAGAMVEIVQGGGLG